jgi:hypothetical protein
MPGPLAGAAAAAAARMIAKKLATKAVTKAVTPAARVRKNTNAATGVAKVKDNYPPQLTNALQKRSVKKVSPTETTRKTAPKTAPKPVAKKTVAVRATGIRSKKLSAAQERAIEAERRFGSSKFDWR